ncbi:MAG: phenylacetate-CoA oxygenase subunit PaaJ [Bacteroidia bacterium]|nr:phenylacetate-CoA oxygenase subunit PaaJ [Bacteroidia bacterium]
MQPEQTILAETAAVWNILRRVPDPEIPVLNVVEMGIVRSVEVNGNNVHVGITPTYSGCPAMDVIGDEIKRSLSQNGFAEVSVKYILSPAWTTDWLTAEAREKLRQYGIAPPEHTTAEKAALSGEGKTVTCPRCKSTHTHMVSNFGSTACKALWQCDDCKEPFDYFKCI